MIPLWPLLIMMEFRGLFLFPRPPPHQPVCHTFNDMSRLCHFIVLDDYDDVATVRISCRCQTKSILLLNITQYHKRWIFRRHKWTGSDCWNWNNWPFCLVLLIFCCRYSLTPLYDLAKRQCFNVPSTIHFIVLCSVGPMSYESMMPEMYNEIRHPVYSSCPILTTPGSKLDSFNTFVWYYKASLL